MKDLNAPSPAPAPAAEIVITLNAAGQIHVTAPLQNKMLCYGLLEVARDVVQGFQPAQAPAILPVNGFLRG